MADDKTETETKAERVDFSKPVFLVMRQTESLRKVYDIVHGDPKQEDLGRGAVEEFAKRKAIDLKTTVAVFGPQIAAFEPPVPAEAKAVGFDFG